MEKILKQVVEFLKQYGMDHSDIDMGKYVSLFLEEMERGLGRTGSSLQMIPTFIEIPASIPSNTQVVVLDAGGTNFRVAVVCFDKDKNPVIKNRKRFSMPGIKYEVSKEEFFSSIASYMKDVADTSSRIGFCFSYPTEILPSKDGRIVHFSKEIKAREVVGELVGKNLVSALKSNGHKGEKRVVLLNDTVTTLLAGTSLLLHKNYDSFVGFILGTGTNCCYLEANESIKKTANLPRNHSQIINVESGDFSGGPQGMLDRQFDKNTNSPSRYTFEKMFSGAYFGELCRLVIDTAYRDRLVSEKSGAELAAIDKLDTKDVSEFLHHPFTGNRLAQAVKEETDRKTLYFLLDRMVERSAKLAAITLSSAVLKSGKGDNPCRPVCISAEGSTFYGLPSLEFRVKYYLKRFLTDTHGRHWEIVNIENATIIGAAIAGLTN